MTHVARILALHVWPTSCTRRFAPDSHASETKGPLKTGTLLKDHRDHRAMDSGMNQVAILQVLRRSCGSRQQK